MKDYPFFIQQMSPCRTKYQHLHKPLLAKVNIIDFANGADNTTTNQFSMEMSAPEQRVQMRYLTAFAYILSCERESVVLPISSIRREEI